MEDNSIFKYIIIIIILGSFFIYFILKKQSLEYDEYNLKLYGIIEDKSFGYPKAIAKARINDSIYYFNRNSTFYKKNMFKGDSISKDSGTLDIHVYRKDSLGIYQEIGVWKKE